MGPITDPSAAAAAAAAAAAGDAAAAAADAAEAVATADAVAAIFPEPFPYNTAALVYYIRPGGDDDNDGLSDVTAFATLAKLRAVMRGFSVNRPIIGDVTGMTFTGTELLELGGDCFGNVDLNFDFAATAPSNFLWRSSRQLRAEPELVLAVTITGQAVDADTGLVNLTVSDTLVAGAHRGQILISDSLTEWGRIRDNDVNTIFTDRVTYEFTPPASIYNYGASFVFGDNTNPFTQTTVLLSLCDWVLHGIRFASTANSKASSLTIYPVAPVNLVHCHLAGLDIYPGPGPVVIDGCYIHSKTFGINGATVALFGSAFRDVNFIFHGSSDSGLTEFIGVSIDDCNTFGGGNAESRFSFSMTNFIISGSSGDAVEMRHLTSTLSTGVIENAAGSAVLVHNHCTGIVDNVKQGAGGANGRYGIEAFDFALVRVSGTTNVTGALDDILAGTIESTYAGMPVNDPDSYALVKAL